MKRAALVALALVALLIQVSCWRPIFDEQISSGALFYQKLGAPFRTIGPVSMDSELQTGEFYPERSIDPYNGFWVVKRSSDIMVSYITYTGSGYSIQSRIWGAQTAGGSSSFVRAGDYTAPNAQLLVGTATGGVATSIDLEEYVSGTPGNVSYIDGTASSGYLGTVSSILGIGAVQESGGNDDKVTVIFVNGSSQIVATDFDLTTAIGNFDAVVDPLNLGGHTLGAFGRVFADYSTGNVTALNYSSGGTEVLRWPWTAGFGTGGSAPTALTVKDPLVAVLSDGSLVCQGTDYLDAYRPDGSEIFSVPAGSVHFVHEVYYAGASYCIFAQPLIAPSNNHNGNNDVYIQLWRIATANFKNLGN